MVDDPTRPLMPLARGIRPLVTSRSSALPAAIARMLRDQGPIRQLPVRGPTLVPSGRRGVKMDEGYFWGSVPEVPVRHHMSVDNQRAINVTPLNEAIPDSSSAQIPIWANNNYPPWNTPPYWSLAFDQHLEGCIPWYLVPTTITDYVVPHDYMVVIKGISYEALNAAQGDVFTISVYANGSLAAQWEDICADETQPNPANRFGINGYTREMPVNIIADHDTKITVKATLQGPLDIDGNSPFFPGEPITTGNCLLKILLNGWTAPLREQVDGGSRPSDLGNFGNLPLEDDQGGWQLE